MKTIVLDDDPTGTQCATNVAVLFNWNTDEIVEALKFKQSVYLQTNSRSLSQKAAVELATSIKKEGIEAGQKLGEEIQFVLRGDSTLRGHVFTETAVFAEAVTPILFLPAYPDVGRTTLDGVHFVEIEGSKIRADETEFAKDPVFGFDSSNLLEFVRQKSNRTGIHVPLVTVRGDLPALIQAFAQAPLNSVIIPDAVTNSDIEKIAEALAMLRSSGTKIVVRCAAPLAASIAGVRSTSMLEGPIAKDSPRALVVVGSHTSGSTKQLDLLQEKWGVAFVINTFEALEDPDKAAQTLMDNLDKVLITQKVLTISSERKREVDHNTLEHGDLVMKSLILVVRKLYRNFDVVIAKGGITSAEVARASLSAKNGWVLGQILPGISVWRVQDSLGKNYLYVVVPGNVGNSDTLLNVLKIVGIS